LVFNFPNLAIHVGEMMKKIVQIQGKKQKKKLSKNWDKKFERKRFF
jgi:hypothetical protein